MTTLLIAANLIAFAAFGFIGFAGDIKTVRNETVAIEKQLPNLQQRHAWVEKAKTCISSPPQADGAQLLAKLTQLCSRLNIETQETAQLSARTPELRLSGYGSFNSISTVFNSVIAEKAVLIKQLKFEQTIGNQWKFETRILVRNGEWEYLPTNKTSPEPEEFKENYAPIHSGKPFVAPRTLPPRPVIQKENLRYIGYFASEATASVIIETGGKFAVLSCGEKTPGGSVIKEANLNELHLSKSEVDGKETEWIVKMEKK